MVDAPSSWFAVNSPDAFRRIALDMRNRNFILIAPGIILALVLGGCGYTILREVSDNDTPPPVSTGVLPDLAITGVTASVETPPQVMDGALSAPKMVFRVNVCNVGPCPFRGSLLITYALTEADLADSLYPLTGDVVGGNLACGDSVTLVAMCPAEWFSSGRVVRFFLRVDNDPPWFADPLNFFGNNPTDEVSLENNFIEVMVR
jgi:hypothetical protein